MKHQNLYIGAVVVILLLALWWYMRKPKAWPDNPYAVNFDTPAPARRRAMTIPRFRQDSGGTPPPAV